MSGMSYQPLHMEMLHKLKLRHKPYLRCIYIRKAVSPYVSHIGAYQNHILQTHGFIILFRKLIINHIHCVS